MVNLLDIASEKTCFFEYTEADGLAIGMIHSICLTEIYWIRKDMLSLDEEKASELCASYLYKKRGKKCKDKDILAKLESIPLFKFDSDYTRVNSVFVIVYI